MWRLLLRILRKTRALETVEVSGMEKEVGLWEVVCSLSFGGGWEWEIREGNFCSWGIKVLLRE